MGAISCVTHLAAAGSIHLFRQRHNTFEGSTRTYRRPGEKRKNYMPKHHKRVGEVPSIYNSPAQLAGCMWSLSCISESNLTPGKAVDTRNTGLTSSEFETSLSGVVLVVLVAITPPRYSQCTMHRCHPQSCPPGCARPFTCCKQTASLSIAAGLSPLSLRRSI